MCSFRAPSRAGPAPRSSGVPLRSGSGLLRLGQALPWRPRGRAPHTVRFSKLPSSLSSICQRGHPDSPERRAHSGYEPRPVSLARTFFCAVDAFLLFRSSLLVSTSPDPRLTWGAGLVCYLGKRVVEGAAASPETLTPILVPAGSLCLERSLPTSTRTPAPNARHRVRETRRVVGPPLRRLWAVPHCPATGSSTDAGAASGFPQTRRRQDR